MIQPADAYLVIEFQQILMIREDADPQSVFNSNHKENALHATALNTLNVSVSLQQNTEAMDFQREFK